MDSVQGKPEENLVETLAIRSMQKAHYTTDNIGHYGLAMDYYTHFTSPIRRYPDMMVHRLLERYLAGGRSVIKNKYEEYCKHCSEMEMVASNAERSSIKYKQVEFMKDKLGQVFDGVVSGVTEWGLYVELNDNKCEGLVPVSYTHLDVYKRQPFSSMASRKPFTILVNPGMRFRSSPQMEVAANTPSATCLVEPVAQRFCNS